MGRSGGTTTHQSKPRAPERAPALTRSRSLSLSLSLYPSLPLSAPLSLRFPRGNLPKLSKEIAFLQPFLRSGTIDYIARVGSEGPPAAESLGVGDLVTFKCFDNDNDINDNCAVEFEKEVEGGTTTLFVTEEEGHGGAYKMTESVPDPENSGSFNVKKMSVSSVMKLQDTLPLSRPAHTFSPPLFGVTVLGNSTGADASPDSAPTGYVIWVNRRGILVNPPPYAAARLDREFGVHPSLISDVIVTSVREGSEGGALQKVMQEEQVGSAARPLPPPLHN
jgi:hypothetical protein